MIIQLEVKNSNIKKLQKHLNWLIEVGLVKSAVPMVKDSEIIDESDAFAESILAEAALGDKVKTYTSDEVLKMGKKWLEEKK